MGCVCPIASTAGVADDTRNLHLLQHQARSPGGPKRHCQMLHIYKDLEVAVPDNVEVKVASRDIWVKGPRGELSKTLKHLNMEVRLVKGPKGSKVRFVVWHGGRKHVACLRTAASVVTNMIKGVTKGFQYKVRAVYAHFPVNLILAGDKRSVEIRNFLGEKRVRHVPMREGVTITDDKAQKDQVLIEGNDINTVSQSAADMHGACLVRNKDIRKFLDGLYVSAKGTVVQDDE